MPRVPMERLRALRAAGRLAAGYPEVAALLAEMLDTSGRTTAATPCDLARVGRLLAGLDPEAVLAEHPDTARITVAFTGSVSVNQLVDPLTAELARHGMLLRPVLGEPGAYARELSDPDGALLATGATRATGATGAELTVFLLDAEVILGRLPVPWRVADAQAAAEEALDDLTTLADRYGRHAAGGTLVLNTIPLDRRCTHQLVDHRSRALLGAVWREFNAGLLRYAADSSSVVVLDLEARVAEGGPAGDPRIMAYLKAPYTDATCAAYAREVAHLARSVRGMAKKCLVLDLDDTLWDGVLGDAGPSGVAAAGTLRGQAFGAFQRVVKQLASQGVLLAISSKNDPEPVLEVLRTHPDMALRESDFARINVNWDTRDGNLRDIAKQIGIGCEALVFADGHLAERDLVRHRVGQVAVVPLDEEPAWHVSRLLQDGWFDVLDVLDGPDGPDGPDGLEAGADGGGGSGTQVAGERRTYREGHPYGERRTYRERTGSIEEYLHQLDVSVELRPPESGEVDRLSQLTLRANQFNLTGLRLRPPEVASRARHPAHRVLAVRTADRFGDNGVVGALFLRVEADRLHIENMLLSRQVFGRGIEQACLSALLAYARDIGLSAVHGRYLPTDKNQRVRDLFPGLAFREGDATDGAREQGAPGGACLCFRHDLREVPEVPGHLRLDARFEGLVGT